MQVGVEMSTVEANTFARIFDWVTLGEGSTLEDFCVIGISPDGLSDDERVTVIGAGAHIRAQTVIYAGNRIGTGFRTGNKVNIRELNRIGDNVSIGTLSVVEHHVEIGDNVRVHTQAFIPEYTVIEPNVWIGPNVVFTNARYPVSRGVKDRLEGAVVREGAIVGANATILPGVTIGRQALIGAGAVVTRDVPDGVVVVGNPAHAVKRTTDIPYYSEGGTA